MSKQEFLSRLRRGLAGLPKNDLEERLNFYSEMIDDRMEEGLSEEEAVAAAGNTDEIVSQILAETPLSTIVKERIKPKRELRAWEIVLIVLGSPIWLSLLIAFAAVIISVYAALWSVIISFWAAFATFVGSSVGVFTVGIVYLCTVNTGAGLALLGAGFVLGGISIFCFIGCSAATKGLLLLTKKFAVLIKNCIAGREKE
ncbi:MAG: DUF1700 domain-containing protein [Ruminococcaceae bacterium]|nr:DUF1700 domain-containing protein [Oscillospiraceae bacterium]